MLELFTRHLDRVLEIWPETLVGSAVIVVFAVAGWWRGKGRPRWTARVVSWWLQHVVRPLAGSRTWARRALIIAANNSLICLVVVLLGSVGFLAWASLACVGLGLGTAVRLMAPEGGLAEPAAAETRPLTKRRRGLFAVGLALNLIEVPAIAVSAGLSLSQGALSSAMSPTDALATFAVVVLPLLIVSAGGEALWMTVSPGSWRFEPPDLPSQNSH